MVIIKRDSATFVYGSFAMRQAKGVRPIPPVSKGLPPPPSVAPSHTDRYAVEILREFSATELIGKLYYQTATMQWSPVAPDYLEWFSWYHFYKRVPQVIVFEMNGSGQWQILHVRVESDDSGTYVAIGLRKA